MHICIYIYIYAYIYTYAYMYTVMVFLAGDMGLSMRVSASARLHLPACVFNTMFITVYIPVFRNEEHRDEQHPVTHLDTRTR